MANPQAENGHVDIANSLMEALAKTRIPGEARQVLDFIFRKTYGWHKKQDFISLSQFSDGTGLSKVHICQALLTLKRMNLITEKGNDTFTEKGNAAIKTYEIQKDFDKWIPLPKKVTLPKKVKTFTEKGKNPLPNSGTTKETITKENILDSSEPKKSAPEPVILIPSKNKKTPDFPIYQEQIDEWSNLYPAVNILQELREMRAWSISHPERQKIKVLAFITNWLSREQDKPGKRDPPKENKYNFL